MSAGLNADLLCLENLNVAQVLPSCPVRRCPFSIIKTLHSHESNYLIKELKYGGGIEASMCEILSQWICQVIFAYVYSWRYLAFPVKNAGRFRSTLSFLVW